MAGELSNLPSKIDDLREMAGKELITFSARDIMVLWEQGVEERCDSAISTFLDQFKGEKLKKDQCIRSINMAADEKKRDMPERDEMTGVYGRGVLFDFLAIVKELGHSKVRLTKLDMNFLKDHNEIEEPTAGDYAIIVLANALKKISIIHNAVVFRFSSSGGDDFIIAEIQDDKSFTEIGPEIERELEQISPETYFSGNVNGMSVLRNDTQKPIVVDSVYIEQLRKEKPEWLNIIIPPSIAWASTEINIAEDIQIMTDETHLNYKTVEAKIEGCDREIKGKKGLKYAQIQNINPKGAALLKRKA